MQYYCSSVTAADTQAFHLHITLLYTIKHQSVLSNQNR
uniref:Uncharacterized protein n=1 Tax=Triticum urartu TaxID=4572 RepID=A0A8R7QIQ4_TRIUA